MRSTWDRAIILSRMLVVPLTLAALSPELFGNEGKSTPPRAVIQVRPVLPEDAETLPEGGRAVIRCTVDASGRVKDPEIKSASNEGYGQAALEAVVKWEFVPATKGGEPVAMRVQIPFNFHPVSKTAQEKTGPGKANLEVTRDVINREFGREVYRKLEEPIVTARQLGRRPRPRGKVRVLYPKELLGSGKTAEAMVGIIIDKEGRVINPRILRPIDPAFSDNALKAAIELEFKPVKRKGEVVYLRMMIQFSFSEKKSRMVEMPSPPQGRGGRGAGEGGAAGGDVLFFL